MNLYGNILGDLYGQPSATLSSPFGKPPRPARPPRENLGTLYPPEEQDSLLWELSKMGMSGVEAFGNILDAPGGAVRAALSGKNPITAFFHPSARPSGRELLTTWGLTKPNDPQAWEWADLAGFAAEIGTDPLVYVRGPLGALTKKGVTEGLLKGATKEGRLLRLAGHITKNPERIAEEIAAGQRNLIALKLPLAKSSVVGFTGPNAARVWEFLHYGPVPAAMRTRAMDTITRAEKLAGAIDMPPMELKTRIGSAIVYPVRWLRSTFGTLDPRLQYSTNPAWQQAVYKAAAHMADTAASIATWHGEITKRLPEMNVFANTALKAYFREYPDDFARWMKLARAFYRDPAIVERMTPEEILRASAEATTKDITTMEGTVVLPSDTLMNVFREATGATKESAWREGPYPAGPVLSNADILARTHTIEKLSKQLGESGSFMQAAENYDKFIHEVLDFVDFARDHAVAAGIPRKELKGLLVRHVPARVRKEFQGIYRTVREGPNIPGVKASATAFGYNARRVDSFRYIGNRYLINEMTKDPELAATAIWKHVRGKWRPSPWQNVSMEEKFKRIWKLAEQYGVAMPFDHEDVDAIRAAYADKDSVIHVYDDFLKWLHNLPFRTDTEKASLHSLGLFSNDALTDSMDYAMKALRAGGAAQVLVEIMAHTAVPDAVGLTVAEVATSTARQGGLGLTEQALDAFRKRRTAMGAAKTSPFDLHLPRGIAKALRNVKYLHQDEKAAENLWTMYDRWMGLFKASVTMPFMAFHNRNRISGIWQNGVSAFRLTRPGETWKAIKGAFDALHGKKVMTPDGEDLLHLALTHDLFMTEKGNRMLDVIEDPGIINVPVTELWKERWSPMRHIRRYKEGVEEIRKGEAVKGLRRIVFGGGEVRLRQVEAQNRLEHFYALILQGVDPAAAARSTTLNHFDYAAIRNSSKIQQGLRRAIPFYGWLRYNTTKQFSDLVNFPGGKAAQSVRALSNINRAAQSGGTFVPPWLRERITIPVNTPMLGGLVRPSESDTSQRFISMQGFLPIEDALDRFPFMAGAPDFPRILQRTGSMLSPLAIWPIEKATGTQLWSGRPLSSIYQTPTENVWINDLIHFGPLSRIATTLRRTLPVAVGKPIEGLTGMHLYDERKNAIDRVSTLLLGGIRVSDIDKERGLMVEGRKIIEDILSKRNTVRLFSRITVKPEDIQQLSPADLRMYSLYLYLLSRSRQAMAQHKKDAQAKKGS